MSDFRRYFVPGGTYFFTLVTARRAALFGDAHARELLGRAMRDERERHPFSTVAMVLLPNHLHVIWTIPVGDDKYSQRWQAIKAKFTTDWLALGGEEQPLTPGYRELRRRGIWQPWFIEHTIRDELDLHNHVDYIHHNPVKHGYVCCPGEWSWSSFRRYVASGDYSAEWGRGPTAPDFRRVRADLLE